MRGIQPRVCDVIIVATITNSYSSTSREKCSQPYKAPVAEKSFHWFAKQEKRKKKVSHDCGPVCEKVFLQKEWEKRLPRGHCRAFACTDNIKCKWLWMICPGRIKSSDYFDLSWYDLVLWLWMICHGRIKCNDYKWWSWLWLSWYVMIEWLDWSCFDAGQQHSIVKSQ